jgi:hypothetical protein
MEPNSWKSYSVACQPARASSTKYDICSGRRGIDKQLSNRALRFLPRAARATTYSAPPAGAERCLRWLSCAAPGPPRRCITPRRVDLPSLAVGSLVSRSQTALVALLSAITHATHVSIFVVLYRYCDDRNCRFCAGTGLCKAFVYIRYIWTTDPQRLVRRRGHQTASHDTNADT